MNDKMMMLLRFVESGDIEEVEEYVIKNGIAIDSKWTDYLLLRTAVRKNHIGITQFLIEQGCRVIKTAKSPINTLLHIAAENHSVEMMNLLQENGASFTQKNQDGDTPATFGIRTMIKSQFVNINFLHMFLENGANVNACTKDGTTLLHLATRRKDDELVEFLIQHKADVNCADKPTGDTPLHIAANNGDLEIAGLLLEHGADITQKNKNGQSPLHVAVNLMKKEIIDIMILSSQNDLSKLLNQVDNLGVSHFHAACISNNSALVLSLLAKGEDVNQSVNENVACIQFRAACISKNPALMTCSLMEKSTKEKLNNKWSSHTPMSFAMISKSEEVVRALLTFDARINPALGKTTIHLAAKHMSKEIVGLILEGGADVSARTDTGKTALHIAAKNGNLDVVEMLIQHKADINCTEKTLNRTPLHYAVSKAHFKIVQVLLKEGADVNAKILTGETALHLVSRGISITPSSSEKLCMELVENCSKTIASLLEAGCDINCTTSDGLTPLCFARTYPCASSAYALLQHGADIKLMSEIGKKSFKLTQIFDEHEGKLKILDLSTNIAKLKIEENQFNNNFIGNDTEENEFLQKYVQQFGEYEFRDMCIERDFAQRCVAELNRMQATKVDRYTSLYSILFKHSTAMSFHALSESFKKMLESEEFTKSFPLYGYLVRLQYKRGITRIGFLSPAKNSLEILARLSLPDSCFESVIKYLKNEDLTNLISATAI